MINDSEKDLMKQDSDNAGSGTFFFSRWLGLMINDLEEDLMVIFADILCFQDGWRKGMIKKYHFWTP